jgi:hypothetical protein
MASARPNAAAGIAATLLALVACVGAFLLVRPEQPTLEAAIMARSATDVGKLLRLGADPYEPAPMTLRGRPATGPVFGKAILSPDVSLAAAFLDHGVNARRPMTFTYLDGEQPQTERLLPLQVAAETRGAMLRLLIRHGAGVNERLREGNTPLVDAVYHGNLGLIRVLLEEGAPVDGRGAGGQTPLIAAAKAWFTFPVWRPQVLTALLDAGANPNARDDAGRTVLHHAVQYNHKPLLRLLVERGADINARDDAGTSPAAEALRRNRRAAFTYLVKELGAAWGPGGRALQ